MAINFLSGLLGGNTPIPSGMPDPNDPLGLGGATRWVNPITAPDEMSNVMMQAQQMPQQAPQQPMPEAPRARRSVLDTVGRISDVIARVGGAEAMYQPGIDAREDRTRQIDLDEMRRKLSEQQIQAGDIGIQDTQRQRLGQALGAIAGNPDAISMWPQIAAQAGIPEEQAAQIGGLLTQRPEMAGPLASSFGYAPQNQGSQAKELQIYSLLNKNSPEMAQMYLKNLTNPDSLTPYQQAQLGISLKGLDLNREKFEFQRDKPTKDDEKAVLARQGRIQAAEAAVPVIAEMRDAFDRLRAAGGINAPGQTGQQRLGAAAYENIPLLERVTNPEGFSAREDLDRLLGQSIQALVPLLGGIQLGGKNIDAGKELEFWRKTIASAKDYNSAIRAVQGFERRIEELTSAPQAAAKPDTSGTPRRIMPRGSRGAPSTSKPSVSNW